MEQKSGLLEKIFGAFGKKEGSRDLVREMEELIEEGSAEGLINTDEGEMLLSVLEFRSTLVREVMIPRTEMVTVDVTSTLDDLVKVMVENGHSRIPVQKGDVDKIVGVVHARDLLNHWNDCGEEVPLIDHIREAYFVPETMKIEVLLGELKLRKIHMAISVNEYGGVSGLVTLEDLLEEIVGDIRDEWDEEEVPMIREVGNGFEVDGRCEIEVFNEKLGLPDGHPGAFETVGGLVFHVLGRVPSPGESFEYEGLDFVVQGADSRRVKSVMVIRREGSASNEAD